MNAIVSLIRMMVNTLSLFVCSARGPQASSGLFIIKLNLEPKNVILRYKAK